MLRCLELSSRDSPASRFLMRSNEEFKSDLNRRQAGESIGLRSGKGPWGAVVLGTSRSADGKFRASAGLAIYREIASPAECGSYLILRRLPAVGKG